MNKITTLKKLGASITAGEILLSTFAVPAFADTNLLESGNGTGTIQNVNVNSNNNTTSVQSNNAVVTNTVTSNSTTGDNDSSANTGGNVAINTGSTSSTTQIQNNLNSNQAQVAGCASCGTTGSLNAAITGNGANSTDNTNVNNNSNVSAFQNNNAIVNNHVDTNSTTGNNTANANTGGAGGGSVAINTGWAVANTAVGTQANANVAVVGGAANGNVAGGTNLLESGNGTGSHNNVNLSSNQSAQVAQDNSAYVTNYVTSNLKTGLNDASANTGVGSVAINTGAAVANTALGTSVNENVAAVGCDCVAEGALNAKIGGNGAFAADNLNVNNTGDTSVFQGGQGAGNQAFVLNAATNNGFTGTNASNANTSGLLFDPETINTGASYSTTTVQTAGNSNIFTTASFPDVNFGFNMNQLWTGLFGM